jgi:copper chaperone CopZ
MSPENMDVFEFNVGGMTCAGCSFSVEFAISNLEGVEKVTVNYLQNGLTQVEARRGTVTLEAIEAALEQNGYHLQRRKQLTQSHIDEKSSNPKKNNFIAYVLAGLMLFGFVIIGYVFANNPQSLPVDIGLDQPNNSNGEVLVLPIVLENTNNSVNIAMDNSNSFYPVIDDDENTSIEDYTVRMLQVPNPDSQITVYLAGLAGCSTCGIEAMSLAQIVDEYNPAQVQVVFVDIYNFGGAEFLIAFARNLEATNLTWTIDVDGAFKNLYQVDIDATLIMTASGEILYRDNVVTSEAVLRNEIEAALASSS